MTTTATKIKTIIVDDQEEYIFNLKEHLSFFPEIELIGVASKYKQAKTLINEQSFDLLFLDVEMPGKNGFELLHECRENGKREFDVIFYTAYDKYTIEALRESAFDYLIKPLRKEELKEIIDRLIKEKKKKKPVITFQKNRQLDQIISLPSSTGLHFTDMDQIVLFQCSGDHLFDKKSWTAVLVDGTNVKLRTGTSAKDIIEFTGEKKFIRINQSTIINLGYLSEIEYKTRVCRLIPPFDHFELTVSRAIMSEIREQYDLI